MERVHYCSILLEGVNTIRSGVLIEEGALTEVVRYLDFFPAITPFFVESCLDERTGRI